MGLFRAIEGEFVGEIEGAVRGAEMGLLTGDGVMRGAAIGAEAGRRSGGMAGLINSDPTLAADAAATGAVAMDSMTGWATYGGVPMALGTGVVSPGYGAPMGMAYGAAGGVPFVAGGFGYAPSIAQQQHMIMVDELAMQQQLLRQQEMVMQQERMVLAEEAAVLGAEAAMMGGRPPMF